MKSPSWMLVKDWDHLNFVFLSWCLAYFFQTPRIQQQQCIGTTRFSILWCGLWRRSQLRPPNHNDTTLPYVKVIHHTKLAEAVKIRAKNDLAATIVVQNCRSEIFQWLFVCPAEAKMSKSATPTFRFWRRFAELREKNQNFRTTVLKVCMN